MMTWYWYLGSDGTAYWSMMPPCYVSARLLGFQDSAVPPSAPPTLTQ